MDVNGAEIVRERMTFTGDVQGVGFRYRAKYAARELGVTGWVENEWDGSVVMEAQGTKEQLYRLVQSISKGTWIDIRHINRKKIPVEEHEYYFDVRGY